MSFTSLNQNVSIRTLIILILAMGLFLPESVWAGPGRNRCPGFYPKLGEYVRQVPVGHGIVSVGANRYHYHAGVYYRKGSKGFTVVRAPMGAVIAHLPVGFATAVVAGITYFVFADIYYQKISSGYMVVKEPTEEPVTEASAQQLQVTVAVLNVRSGPGIHYPVTTRVRMGDRLMIKGSAPGWNYVQLPNGSHGWVMTKYTRSVAPDAKG
jgi:hypothetical protein